MEPKCRVAWEAGGTEEIEWPLVSWGGTDYVTLGLQGRHALWTQIYYGHIH